MSRRRLYSTRCITASIALLLTTLVLPVPTPALAGARLHPALFALSTADFPVGSQLVRSGIESNRQLFRDQYLHFGRPPAALGRRTGYYMDMVEGDPAAASHAYTSYLVSIFRTQRQAEAALDIRWNIWFAVAYYSTPAPAPISLGDAGTEALFHTVDPSQPPLSELFFQRGSILVEVFQASVGIGSTNDQLHSLWTIATELDTLASQHPRGS